MIKAVPSIQIDDQVATLDLLKTLTKREWEVIRYLSNGLTSSQIASEIFIEPKSVENYRSRIAHKLNLKGRNKLVWYCWTNKEIIEKYYRIFISNYAESNNNN
jgi:DNA-binding NarL/FixJ family response regulator